MRAEKHRDDDIDGVPIKAELKRRLVARKEREAQWAQAMASKKAQAISVITWSGNEEDATTATSVPPHMKKRNVICAKRLPVACPA